MTTPHRPIRLLSWATALLWFTWISACAAPQGGQLKRVETPAATQPWQNWTITNTEREGLESTFARIADGLDLPTPAEKP